MFTKDVTIISPVGCFFFFGFRITVAMLDHRDRDRSYLGYYCVGFLLTTLVITLYFQPRPDKFLGRVRYLPQGLRGINSNRASALKNPLPSAKCSNHHTLQHQQILVTRILLLCHQKYRAPRIRMGMLSTPVLIDDLICAWRSVEYEDEACAVAERMRDIGRSQWIG